MNERRRYKLRDLVNAALSAPVPQGAQPPATPLQRLLEQPFPVKIGWQLARLARQIEPTLKTFVQNRENLRVAALEDAGLARDGSDRPEPKENEDPEIFKTAMAQYQDKWRRADEIYREAVEELLDCDEPLNLEPLSPVILETLPDPAEYPDRIQAITAGELVSLMFLFADEVGNPPE